MFTPISTTQLETVSHVLKESYVVEVMMENLLIPLKPLDSGELSLVVISLQELSKKLFNLSKNISLIV